MNALRLAVSRVNVERTGAEFFSPNDVGINIFTYVPKYITLSVTGGFSLGGGTSTASTFRTTFYQLSDDVSVVRGTHQLAFGGRAANGRSNTYSLNGSSGSFSFNGQSLNLGMADFFLGQLASYSQASPLLLLNRQYYFGLYAQDTWKATPKLTVNYGVRWQPFTTQHATNDFVYNFDYSRFQQGLKSAVYKNAPAGLIYPGDPGFPGNAGYNPIGRCSLRAWDSRGIRRVTGRRRSGLRILSVMKICRCSGACINLNRRHSAITPA